MGFVQINGAGFSESSGPTDKVCGEMKKPHPCSGFDRIPGQDNGCSQSYLEDNQGKQSPDSRQNDLVALIPFGITMIGSNGYYTEKNQGYFFNESRCRQGSNAMRTAECCCREK